MVINFFTHTATLYLLHSLNMTVKYLKQAGVMHSLSMTRKYLYLNQEIWRYTLSVCLNNSTTLVTYLMLMCISNYNETDGLEVIDYYYIWKKLF
jgi:hypothetical protein